MVDRPDFRRVILTLGPGSADRQLMRAAVDFARLLQLEMVGVFVEDRAVLGLGGLPFVRELRLPDRAWQSFDPERVLDELRAAARQAKKVLDEEGSARGMTCRFEIRRGDPATAASEQGELTDIVVVGEPAEAAGWSSPSVTRARRSALISSASVLFLPSTETSRGGPIVAMAHTPEEPAVSLASRIAKAAGEELVFVRSAERSPDAMVASLDLTLGHRRERLTVMARTNGESSAELLTALSARRNAPVLVVEAGLSGAKKRSAS